MNVSRRNRYLFLTIFFTLNDEHLLKAMDNCPSEAYVIVTLMGHLSCEMQSRI